MIARGAGPFSKPFFAMQFLTQHQAGFGTDGIMGTVQTGNFGGMALSVTCSAPVNIATLKYWGKVLLNHTEYTNP